MREAEMRGVEVIEENVIDVDQVHVVVSADFEFVTASFRVVVGMRVGRTELKDVTDGAWRRRALKLGWESQRRL